MSGGDVVGALVVVPEVGERLLSMREASRVAGGLHRNTLRRLWSQTDEQGQPRFPKPVEMSPGRYGFLASELRAWIATRPRVEVPR
jgi:predicted DNA-binding transcriptional regulator AlpA